MSQLLVRNLQEEVVERLKHRAKANHRSLQAELALILENAANIQQREFWQDANAVREQLAEYSEKYKHSFSDSAELIREERDK